MGRALHAALGAGYSQHVHFIGHSLGTIVNRIACDFVHGKLPEAVDRVSPNVASPWSLVATTPHITLLDEAEIASVFQQSVSTSTELAWKVAGLKGAVVAGVPVAIATWKSPIPQGVTWVDNYISMVGVQRPEAVNVALLKPAFTFANPIAAHGYAHEWYRWSVDLGSFTPAAAPPAIGYRLSRDYVAAFPPSGTGKTAGGLWYENLGTTDALDLFNQPDPEDFEANAIVLNAYAVQAGAKECRSWASCMKPERPPWCKRARLRSTGWRTRGINTCMSRWMRRGAQCCTVTRRASNCSARLAAR